MAYYVYNDYTDEWFSISGLGIPQFKTKAEQQEFVKMVVKAYPDLLIDKTVFRYLKRSYRCDTMFSESISYEAYIRSRHVKSDPYQYILNHLQPEQRQLKKGDLIIFTRYNEYDDNVPVMLASGTYIRDVGGYFEADYLGRVDAYPKTALIAVVNRPKRYMRRLRYRNIWYITAVHPMAYILYAVCRILLKMPVTWAVV